MTPVEEPKAVEAPKVRVKKPNAKTDPKLIAAARELRDRHLERINQAGALEPRGKYLIGRGTWANVEVTRVELPAKLLEAA